MPTSGAGKTNSGVSEPKHRIHIRARRVFRLSLTMSISLAIAYGAAAPLPFIAPIFALVLGVKPAPPIGLKMLAGLVVVVMATLGVGLLLIPLLINYPVSAVLIVALGIYFSTYLTVIAGKALVGTFLTMGITIISAAGMIDFSVATTVIQGLVVGIIIAVVCQWAVYPWFPEDPSIKETSPAEKNDMESPNQSNWIAIRSTLIVLPAYLLGLTNPAVYLPIIMKAVALSQQGSTMNARDAGRQLLGSTFLGGCYAVLFWFALDLVTTLWMFTACILLFSIHMISKLYGLSASRFPPEFWQNVLITMLILVGPAVEDSADGKDVYQAFFVRMGLFVAVTLYACGAVYLLEIMRFRRIRQKEMHV